MMATISPPYRLLCDRCRRESDVLLPLRVEGAVRPGWWLCPRCHRIVSRQVELSKKGVGA